MKWLALVLMLAALSCVNAISLARAPAPRPKERYETREADRLIKWLYEERRAAELLQYPVKVALTWPSEKHSRGNPVVYTARAASFDADGWVSLHECLVAGVWD